MPDNQPTKEQTTGKAEKQKGTPLPLRVYRLHNTFLKLGQRIGGPLIRLTAYYCLYKIFSNGGTESLAFVSYQHMLNEGKELWDKKHGTQRNVRKSKG